ncbi:MAG: hypothetical protein FWG82_00755 [Oscillospiraceae bacterium]|nr:hypothetical protein [Oscillospiraceae bacterium]
MKRLPILKSHSNKHLWIIFFVVLPLTVAARFHHIKNLLEPAFGFYASRDWTVTALGVLLTLTSGFYLCYSFINRKSETGALIYKKGKVKSRVTVVLSFFLALMLLSDVYACYQIIMDNFQDFQYSMRLSDDTGIFAEGMFTNLMKTGIFPALMEGLFAVPSAVFAVVFGVQHMKKTSHKPMRLLAIFPSLWLVMRTIYHFTNTLSFMRVSELFYELAAMAFTLIFLINFAQAYSSINENRDDWALTGVGFPAALFALMGFLSRLLIFVTGNSENLTAQAPLDFMELALALFILSVLRVRVREKKGFLT